MKIYDISQEVLSSITYPGDPVPKRKVLKSIDEGELYNLSYIEMCVHNGTHIDAPFHFINDGKTVEDININSFVGMCLVAEHNGIVTGDDARNIIKKAKMTDGEASRRILIKGNAEVSLDAAEIFAGEKILLLGNESQSVGPEDAPMAVHKALLGEDVILLEGIRLGEVSEGAYLLCAAPLNVKGAEGSPCRAVLIDLK